MERLSLLHVFDNPLLGVHIVMTDGEKDARRKYGNKRMNKFALEFIREFSSFHWEE